MSYYTSSSIVYKRPQIEEFLPAAPAQQKKEEPPSITSPIVASFPSGPTITPLLIMNHDCHIMTAENLDTRSLTRYIQILKESKRSFTQTIAKLSALIVEKLQEEGSSSSIMRRITITARENLLSNLITRDAAYLYVRTLNILKFRIDNNCIRKFVLNCSQLKELNISGMILNSSDLALLIGMLPKLKRLGYQDLHIFHDLINDNALQQQMLNKFDHLKQMGSEYLKEHLQMLYDSACIEIAEGRVIVDQNCCDFAKFTSLFVWALINNQNISSSLKIINLKMSTGFGLTALEPSKDTYQKIFERCIHLQKINLRDCKEAIGTFKFLSNNIVKLNLSQLSLDGTEIENLPTNLTHLSMNPPLLHGNYEEVFRKFEMLTSLEFMGQFNDDLPFLPYLPSGLKKLNLSYNDGSRCSFPYDMLHHLPDTLEDLAIRGEISSVPKDIFKSTHLPRSLTSLHLSIINERDRYGQFIGNNTYCLIFDTKSDDYQWPSKLTNLSLELNSLNNYTVESKTKIPLTVKNLTVIANVIDFSKTNFLTSFPDKLEVLKFESLNNQIYGIDGRNYKIRPNTLPTTLKTIVLPPPHILPLSYTQPRLGCPTLSPTLLFSEFNATALKILISKPKPCINAQNSLIPILREDIDRFEAWSISYNLEMID